jgi:hypothetical protein
MTPRPRQRRPPSITLTSTQKGYVAGVLDAKGHLSIVRVDRGPSPAVPSYMIRFVLHMRDPSVPKAIAGLVPWTAVVAVKHRDRRSRPDFKLQVGLPTLLTLLETLVPVLHRQRPTVQLILRLAALRRRLLPSHRTQWAREAAAIYKQFCALQRSTS